MQFDITGIIGKDFVAENFIEQLNNSKGDITVNIDSPGGSIPKGLLIIEALKKYKGKKTGIVGDGKMAASMASVILQAFDNRVVYETSSLMIHNAQAEVKGDHNLLQRVINFMKMASNKLATIYAGRSGKNINEIKSYMDEEKVFFGQEIVDAGFADEIIKVENKKDNDDYILNCMLVVDDMKKTFIDDISETDINNCMNVVTINAYNPVQSGENKLKKGVQKTMNKSELMTQHPDLYAEIKQDGANEAYSNVSNHLKMMQFDKDLVMRNIDGKKDFMACVADYTALSITAKKLSDTVEETAELAAVSTPATSATETVDEVEELMAEYKKIKGVK